MSVNIKNTCNCSRYDSTVYELSSEHPCKYDRITFEYAVIAGADRVVRQEFYLGTQLQFTWEFAYDGSGNVIEKLIY